VEDNLELGRTFQVFDMKDSTLTQQNFGMHIFMNRKKCYYICYLEIFFKSTKILLYLLQHR